jgi:type III restriction enzyme
MPPLPTTVIENPVINSPFEEPARHFKFDDEGITNTVVEGRRASQYFIPIAKPRKRGGQIAFDTEWTKDRIEENKLVNRVRERVNLWRRGGYVGVTPTTARLLAYWTRPDREKRLFFCQIEAMETAIYLAEVARKHGDGWLEAALREANDGSNPGLPRVAFKMATGSGKTVVMAMLIAWQALNKLDAPMDARFSETFLIVTPGITIKDRLRVLLPNDPDNYYRQRDVLPAELIERLTQARVLVTNYHAFKQRERGQAARLTKGILAGNRPAGPSPFVETPAEMIRRVCRELGTKKNIVVINDEAHHCYRRRPDAEDEAMDREDREEARKRDEEARIWISGLEAAKAKIGVRAIFDLSATPFFLRGSGWSEGTLFPWVVSDFSLIDAIESGIVKVPRVPVSDDSMAEQQPTYRDLWPLIREQLPKKGRKSDGASVEPKLPHELEGALHSLYSHYENQHRLWQDNREAQARGLTAPVFIVVCNNTNVSKMVFDWVAGWEKTVMRGRAEPAKVVQAGQLRLFRNDDEHGGWKPRPTTILVDSEQLESGEAMSADFKKLAATEIEELKADYRARFPGRDAADLTDEDILREVMNTVGKPGKLGEHVKCVVSVSMLTEGWDANTVTHVLGVRAFGTQLLCEQVVGRALRRMSYAAEPQRVTAGEREIEILGFPAEYAEVYGVPFSFIPCSGSSSDPKPGRMPTRVRAIESREDYEITFPRLAGYRYEVPAERLSARFTDATRLVLSTRGRPTKTENAPIVGEGSVHTLDDLRGRREAEVAFKIAKRLLEKYFRADSPDAAEADQGRPWLFPRLLEITKHWMGEQVVYKDNTFPQLLLMEENAHDASDRIYRAIVAAEPGQPTLRAILRPYDSVGSTSHVDFDTTRPVYATNAAKCHVSHVVADTGSWEQKLAQTLEDMPEVVRYVKNHNLGFVIPYTLDGDERAYHPDFLVDLNDGHGTTDLLHLIVEVTGERKKDKEAKVATARDLWLPAVNGNGTFGRWAFLEVEDPWNAATVLRTTLGLTAPKTPHARHTREA